MPDYPSRLVLLGIFLAVLFGFGGLATDALIPCLAGLVIDVVRDPPSSGVRVTTAFATSGVFFAPALAITGAVFGWWIGNRKDRSALRSEATGSVATPFAFGIVAAVVSACGAFIAVAGLLTLTINETANDNGGAVMTAGILAFMAAKVAAVAGGIVGGIVGVVYGRSR